MLPEDDYLRLKPANSERKTAVRIALAALLGCFVLISVLALQASITPGTRTGSYISHNNETRELIRSRDVASHVIKQDYSSH
ncbi:hypothetical protein OEG84_09730 [Hoeflea sp. G2-23]|uniref:Uncharacterized protein n=1 Tax=Hoeflea algicola TaxID=2983763 RepID=A0ABT3Z9P7_9HYPH|nr:hypothetical protein [Hoeflea algicola]MCY0147981.1 hypothetical protein [Hoeflea algicola]